MGILNEMTEAEFRTKMREIFNEVMAVHEKEWEKVLARVNLCEDKATAAERVAEAVLVTLRATGSRSPDWTERNSVPTAKPNTIYGSGWWDACVYLKERFQRVGDKGHGNFEAFFNEANDAMNKGKRQE